MFLRDIVCLRNISTLLKGDDDDDDDDDDDNNNNNNNNNYIFQHVLPTVKFVKLAITDVWQEMSTVSLTYILN